MVSQTNGARVLTLASPVAQGLHPVAPISETTARLLSATAVLGIGLIHILDAAATYHSTGWISWAYVTLIAAAVPFVESSSLALSATRLGIWRRSR